MSFLYKSASGHEVQHGSHSALDSFRFCRRKFKLNRILGWRRKGRSAALEFGKAVEDAIQYFHANGMKKGDCLDEFTRIWLKWADQELIYTDQEGSFFELMAMGKEMARLYEVRVTSLPIRNPKFQLQYRKAIFPGSTLADLEFLGYVDMLSTLEDGTRLLIDIKTAKSGLDLTPNMLAMDSQLREYAWLSGIRDVAFMWFVKSKARVVHGDTVALLEEFGDWKAGADLTAVKYEKSESGEERVLVGVPTAVQIMDEAIDKITGKGAKAATAALTEALIADGTIQWVPRDTLAKVKLQFVKARIPESVLPDVGQRIGHEMIQIKSASETDSFFQDGGVRFPNQICTWCEHRGICLGDNQLRDALLVQIKPAADEPDWLDESEEA